MTTKRFTLTNPKNAFQEMKCGIDDRGNTLTFNEVIDLLNELSEENEQLKKSIKRQQGSNDECAKLIKEQQKENEQLKEHQRTLEAKIVRLKDRVKTFEKHYSLKDIERYKKMDNCNCITSRRLEE